MPNSTNRSNHSCQLVSDSGTTEALQTLGENQRSSFPLTWPLTSTLGHCSLGSGLSPCASVTATATRRQWVPSAAPTESRTSQPASPAAPNQWVHRQTGASRPAVTPTHRTLTIWFKNTCSRITSWPNVVSPAFLCCQNLSSCACISSSSSEEAAALPGKCPSPGCQEAFLTFLCVICVCSMIGAMAQTPSVIILIRQVDLRLLPSRGGCWHS